MTDYRELFGVSELAREADDGDGVRIAVIDTGIPKPTGFYVGQSCNLTSDRAEDTGHATFVGSILFGTGSVHGLCTKATAGFIKVFDRGVARPETVAKAILHAATDWKADVINLSLGFSRARDCPESLRTACRKAHELGVTIVAAAGNDGGQVLWPAALPETICVGSADGNGRELFSNAGEVDFVISGRDLDGLSPDGAVVRRSGTSFSTAIVTGLLALLLARRRRQGLGTSTEELKYALAGYCQDMGDSGWDEDTGFGFPFYAALYGTMADPAARLRENSVFGRIKSLIRTIVTKLTRRIHGNE